MYRIVEQNIAPDRHVVKGPDKFNLALALLDPEITNSTGQRVRRAADFYTSNSDGTGYHIDPMAVEMLQRGPEQEGDERDSMGLRFIVGGPAMYPGGTVRSMDRSDEAIYYTVHYDLASATGSLAVHRAILAAKE
jgi:hypothetical protein